MGRRQQDTYPDRLSGGEQQWAAIVRALRVSAPEQPRTQQFLQRIVAAGRLAR